MDIEELAKKYELTGSDFWELPQRKGTWIVKHDACERITKIENIVHEPPTVYLELGSVYMVGFGVFGDIRIWTTGEASPENCHNKYYGAMAEKRLKDRLTLKLIDAYEHGIYSEVEADEFDTKEAPEFSRDYRITFGKYGKDGDKTPEEHKGKGTPLNEIDDGYLGWLNKKSNQEFLKEFAGEELRIRMEHTQAYPDEILTKTHLVIDSLLNADGMPKEEVEKTNKWLGDKPTEKEAQKRLVHLTAVINELG